MKQYHYQLSDHHVRWCEQYPCPCPNECGTPNMPRQDVPTHRIECPLEPVECPFAEAGCEIKLVRNQLDTHLTESQQTHLLKLMTDYRKCKATLAVTKQTLIITTGRLESMQEGVSREDLKAKVTRDPLKSIRTKINDEGIEHGLQFSIPTESYFKDNREWYSPAFYVRDFKTCVLARYNPRSGELEWALVVLGTERGKCGDILHGQIENSLIEFNLPCAHDPSEMYMYNVIKGECDGEIKPKPQPLSLTVYIYTLISLFCDRCTI